MCSIECDSKKKCYESNNSKLRAIINEELLYLTSTGQIKLNTLQGDPGMPGTSCGNMTSVSTQATAQPGYRLPTYMPQCLKCKCENKCKEEKCKDKKLQKLILEELEKLICFGLVDVVGPRGEDGPDGTSCFATGVIAMYVGNVDIIYDPTVNGYVIPFETLQLLSDLTIDQLDGLDVSLLESIGSKIIPGTLTVDGNNVIFKPNDLSYTSNINPMSLFVYGEIVSYVKIPGKVSLSCGNNIVNSNEINFSNDSQDLVNGKVQFFSKNGELVGEATIINVNTIPSPTQYSITVNCTGTQTIDLDPSFYGIVFSP